MTLTALADAPSRATTTITLSWGLLTIPLSVYTGTETTRVDRKEFLMVGDSLVSVGRSPIRKDTGEVIDSGVVVRMAQAESGAWVALSDDEIAACTSPRGMAEVISFVKLAKVGQYLTEDVKQVRTKREKGKINPAAEKALTLLFTAMARRKVMALVRVAMRGPARYCLLDSTGNLFLVHTADAVRGMLPQPTASVSDQELALADSLIDAVGIDAPVLMDTTAPVVQEFVNNKAAGVEPQTPAAPAPVGVDIMSQLMASIDAAKVK